MTPYLQKPLALGADVVIHSATKYLAGHSDVNAGLVVVSGEDLASRVYFAQNRLGGVLAPAECDAVRRGIQTLALRMDRQQENANAIARYLLVHPLVKAVHYPGSAPQLHLILTEDDVGAVLGMRMLLVGMPRLAAVMACFFSCLYSPWTGRKYLGLVRVSISFCSS